MSTSCPHCGAAMDDGSRFCSVCGRPIPAMQEEATVFVLKPGTACLEETDECISPPPRLRLLYRSAKNALPASCGIWRLRKVRLRIILIRLHRPGSAGKFA